MEAGAAVGQERRVEVEQRPLPGGAHLMGRLVPQGGESLGHLGRGRVAQVGDADAVRTGRGQSVLPAAVVHDHAQHWVVLDQAVPGGFEPRHVRDRITCRGKAVVLVVIEDGDSAERESFLPADQVGLLNGSQGEGLGSRLRRRSRYRSRIAVRSSAPARSDSRAARSFAAALPRKAVNGRS